MAKKKTENIKAVPVLRAGSGGEQPTPTPEQTGTRTYQITDPWKDRGVVNLVDVKSVDGEITDVKVNGEPAGGGGGGSVTTAEVTFVNNTNDEEVEIQLPFLDQTPSGYYFNTTYHAIQGSNDPIITPLYNGQTQTVIPGYNLEVSGSATVDVINVTITGNCTITIS